MRTFINPDKTLVEFCKEDCEDRSKNIPVIDKDIILKM